MFSRPSVVVPQNDSPKTFIDCLEYCLKYFFFNYMFSVHNYMFSVHNFLIYVWKSVHNYMFSVHNYMFRYATICFPYTTIWFPYTTYSDIVFRTQLTQLYVWNNVWNNVCELKQYLGPNLDSRSCRAFKNIQLIRKDDYVLESEPEVFSKHVKHQLSRPKNLFEREAAKTMIIRCYGCKCLVCIYIYYIYTMWSSKKPLRWHPSPGSTASATLLVQSLWGADGKFENHSMWAMIKKPVVWGYFWGWNPTQLCGDYIYGKV